MKRFLIILSMFIFTTDSFASGIGTTPTAPCDNATLSKYTGTVNAEINWEPNEIQLGWYDGNTKLDVPVSAQSCTYDGMITVPPQPTKPGYTFNGWKVMGLPTGYTKLEYLQGNGNQYINTNYIPNNNTGVKTKIQFNTVENLEASCFGAGEAHNSNAFELYPWDQRLEFNYGNTPVTLSVAGPVEANEIIEIDWNKNRVNYKINYGITRSFSFLEQTFTAPYQMRLFDVVRPYNVNSEPYLHGKIKIYYFQIYDNNVIVRNFIPAKNSSNVLGMYDTVTQTFFTNAGTGTFTAGPVVQ